MEDEKLLLDLVSDLLESQMDLAIAGTSEDGLEGYRRCLELRPDFAILDIRLPSLNGCEVALRLRRELPEIKILVFSGLFSPNLIRRLMKARVNGLMEKAAGLREMEKAIRAVASGQTYFGPEIAKKIPEIFLRSSEENSLASLTDRERDSAIDWGRPYHQGNCRKTLYQAWNGGPPSQ